MRLSIGWKYKSIINPLLHKILTPKYSTIINKCCHIHFTQHLNSFPRFSWAWNWKLGIHITLYSAVCPDSKSKRWPFHNTWCCSLPCFEVILALIILPEFIDFGFEILCSAVQLCRQNCVLCRESISLLFLPYNIYHITNHATTKSPPPCFHVLTTCLLIWESW